MTTKTKLVLAALSCVALSLAIWALVREPAPPPSPPGLASAGEAAPVGVETPASDRASRPEVTRRALPAPSRATSGSLLVRVAWEDTKEPAAGVNLRVSPLHVHDTVYVPHEAITDARGEALLHELEIGGHHVQTDRELIKQATVAAGVQTELVIELPAACTVEGRVVDARQQPIGDALILLCTSPGSDAQPIARTGADGNFRVRGIGPNVLLEARAEGHAPSMRHPLKGNAGSVVRITLTLEGAGGSLAGLVRGPNGPIADGVVRIGEMSDLGVRFADGSSGYPPSGARVRTGADGRFRCAGLAPGKQKVLVRAAGHGPFHGESEITVGHETYMTIDLVRGVTVAGKVTNHRDEPVDDYLMYVGFQRGMRDWHWASIAWTRADGSYELRDLAPGSIEVLAGEYSTVDQPDARAKLHGNPGDRLRWDVKLSEKPAIRGRVVDERNQPVVNAMVHASDIVDGTRTDAAGRFVLVVQQDLPTRLTVKVNQLLVASLDDVRPGPNEVLITVRERSQPSIHVTGRVLDEAGKPLLGATVHLTRLTDDFHTSPAVKEETGGFRSGPHPAGFWLLSCSAPGRARIHLPPREVHPNETWDVGEIRLPIPGRLRVTAKHRDGRALAKASATLGSSESTLDQYLSIKDGAGAVGGLAPGGYLLHAHVEGCASLCVPFTVTAERETSLDLVVDPGIAQTIRFRVPQGQVFRVLHVVLRDSGGGTVADQWLLGRGDRDWKLGLRPGKYRVDASTPNGWRGQGEFEVWDTAQAPVSVELR